MSKLSTTTMKPTTMPPSTADNSSTTNLIENASLILLNGSGANNVEKYVAALAVVNSACDDAYVVSPRVALCVNNHRMHEEFTTTPALTYKIGAQTLIAWM